MHFALIGKHDFFAVVIVQLVEEFTVKVLLRLLLVSIERTMNFEFEPLANFKLGVLFLPALLVGPQEGHLILHVVGSQTLDFLDVLVSLAQHQC